jgi:membrane-associated protease RseP (regulator of RpoE activity)
VTFGVALFIFAILAVIMIHEAGHFFVAKAYDFKATKFFLGFGPTLWSRRKGETEFGVKALPLGGFVKIVGMNPYEEVPPEDQARSYPNKPKWQRALVLLGGPATHWVVAFILLTIMASTVGFGTGRASNEIAAISTRIDGEETPASLLGLQPDDRITAVDGTKVVSWAQISDYIKAHPGEEAAFTVRRDGEALTFEAQLGRAIFGPDGEVVAYAPPGEELRALRAGESEGGFLGVSPAEEFETTAFPGSALVGAQRTWDVTTASVRSVYTFFDEKIFGGGLFQSLGEEGERGLNEAVGLVGAGRIAGGAVARGQFAAFLYFIVYLTVIIGLMNLLPLPPLDGGHLAVLAYEALSRRRVDIRKLIPLSAAVISFFLIMFFMILYLDIVRPVEPF